MFEEQTPDIIFEGDSKYNHITITEQNGVRTLYLGALAQEAETSISIYNPEEPVFEYPGMVLLSLALRPKARKIAMLGLGGGFVPRLCQRYLPDYELTVVEIDPLIADLAATYFGFQPGGNVRVEIQDGLEFLSRQPAGSYDIIWLDAFDGDYIPVHLTTSQFLELNRSILREDGLLVQNLHSNRKYFYHRQLALTSAVFEEPSLIFRGFRCANDVVITPNGPAPIPRQRREIAKAVRAFPAGQKIGPYDLMEEVRKMIAFPEIPASERALFAY
ncbi:MAG: fused MFS/spermidine synthase [Deltaproteobacteria bacterium]|nr:fused MFS/spermidine synthase [Deltaproteobacteria bacterium]